MLRIIHSSSIVTRWVRIILFIALIGHIISDYSIAEGQSPSIARIFSSPLGYRDGASYEPRINYQNGTLIENTDYGVINPDMPGGTCFGVNWNQIYHSGVDLYRKDGTSTKGAEVTAVADGIVKWISYDFPYGVIIIEHSLPPDGSLKIYSLYGHLENNSVSVNVNSPVTRGQKLGVVQEQWFVGLNTPFHDDSHLHFEMRYFYNASNIYSLSTSCNGYLPGRGYTYPEIPDNFPPSQSQHYTNPRSFVSAHRGYFLPLIMKPTCEEGAQLITNGGFEQGNASWNVVSYYNVILSYPNQSPVSPRTGSWLAFLGGANNINNDTNMERLSQDISFISNTSSFTFTYYDKILSDEGTTQPWDYLYVRLYDGNWGFIQTIDTMDNRSKDLGYIARSINVQINPQWIGQTLHLSFEANTDSTNLTDFFIDDVGLVTHCN